VAQREELDEIFESCRQGYGEEFIVFCNLQHLSQNSKNRSGQKSGAKKQKLMQEYIRLKHKKFYLDILDQLLKFSKAKELKSSDSEQESDQESSNIDFNA
jgi:predicted peptidase